MARRSLLLPLALLFVTTFLFVAALEAPRRLRGSGHHALEEAEDDWPADGAWADDDDPAADSSFFAGADELEGWDPLLNANATPMDGPGSVTTPMLADTPAAEVTAVAAAASQQGPPANANRWIGYDNEYEDPTYFFPGDVKPTWESVNGEIRLNGRPFHVKGISWFGTETDTRVFHGLDRRDANFYLDLLRQHGFNLLRIPISLAAALDLDSRPRYGYFADPKFRDKTVGELLQRVIYKAGKRGILVLLDMHRARENEKWEVWYTKEYSYEDLLRGWHNLLDTYKHQWNVVGLDLLNEPHGPARWEGGERATDWNRAAEDMIAKLGLAHADWRGLFFVEGVSDPYPHAAFWGSNLYGVRRAPIAVSAALDRRVVYSPHTYGPSVQNQDYFQDPAFPRNMPRIWDDLFGFVENATGRAVVMGEWGGYYHPNSPNLVWTDAFAAYLRDRCLSDNIYWDLNPNSGDTGGILRDDWTTPRIRRLALLHWVQPHPSRLFFDGRQYVFKPGAYAKPECDRRPRPQERAVAPPPPPPPPRVVPRPLEPEPEPEPPSMPINEHHDRDHEREHDHEQEQEQHEHDEHEHDHERDHPYQGRIRGWAMQDW